MTAKKKRLTDPVQIPSDMNEKDAAEFWATHEVTEEYLEKAEQSTQITEEEVLPPRSKPISVRFPEYVIQELKAVAKEKHVGYQTLLKELVIEGLSKLTKAATERELKLAEDYYQLFANMDKRIQDYERLIRKYERLLRHQARLIRAQRKADQETPLEHHPHYVGRVIVLPEEGEHPDPHEQWAGILVDEAPTVRVSENLQTHVPRVTRNVAEELIRQSQ
jgi:predicted DNA binding CopG/RHH family protein